MSEFQIMSNILSATGIYDISLGEPVYAEIMAYAEGLDMLFGEVEELLRECFVSTAESYGLTYREDWIKKYIYKRNADIDNRRNAVINTLSVCQTDYTCSGMRKISDSFNINGNFHSYTSPLKVTFECTDAITDTQKNIIEDQMKRFMPCWLPFELVKV